MRPPPKLIENCEFKYKCDKQWNELRIIPDTDDSYRGCDVCKKLVYFVTTEEELSYRICRSNCVAIDPLLYRKILDREMLKALKKPRIGYVTFKSGET